MPEPQSITADAAHAIVSVVSIPRRLQLYSITDHELTMLFSAYTSPTLTFLGLAVGAAISFWISLLTVSGLDNSAHAAFLAMAIGASVLAVFFGWLSYRAWRQARTDVTKIITSSDGQP